MEYSVLVRHVIIVMASSSAKDEGPPSVPETEDGLYEQEWLREGARLRGQVMGNGVVVHGVAPDETGQREIMYRLVWIFLRLVDDNWNHVSSEIISAGSYSCIDCLL